MRPNPFQILSLLLLILSASVSAQEIEWQRTIGGTDSDALKDIQPTNDGGFICAGSSRSITGIDKTEWCIGQSDYWILKLDANGNTQWQNTIGGTSYDFPYSVQQCTDGGYIVGGTSGSDISGDKTGNCRGEGDYWIVKLDVNGIVQWDKTIGGNKRDILEVVYQTSDGGFYCAGHSYSDSSGEKSENSLGRDDFWIVKLDSIGNILWQNTIGGAGDDILFDSHPTSDGGYICAGYSNSDSSADKSENNFVGNDYWLVKLDSLGILQWENTMGANRTDQCNSVQQTSDGGFILGGISDSDASGDKLEDNVTLQYDYWIIKTDASGAIQWQNTIGGELNEELKISIRQTKDKGYACAGTSRSNALGDKDENCIGSYDYWLIKLDENGNIEFQNTIGGDDTDYLESLEQTADGGYICGGFTMSGISGDKTDINKGSWDFWIMKLNGKINLIKGSTYFDANNNNFKDAGEVAVKNKKIVETSTGRFSFSDDDGNYSLAVTDSGYYSVNTETQNLYSTAPLLHTAYFNGFIQSDTLNDFAFQSAGNFNDLCVTITPTGAFRSGMNANYQIDYVNQGTTTLTPTLVFYPDPNITYASASITPALIFPDSIIFSVPALGPFQTGQILVNVSVNTGLPIGTIINSGVLILPVSGDINPGCNQSYWEVHTTGSFDPNDIQVDRNTLFDYELNSPPYLEYLVRFQNTGNDTAFYVRVENKITSKLQLNTFEFVAASHPCTIQYQEFDSTMKFIFENIQLADSNVNEAASHGFVRYKIKPVNTLFVNDSILNHAKIYFDYNPPVKTNTANTVIVTPTSIKEIGKNNISVFPNPFENEITVELKEIYNQEIVIEINNLYGQNLVNLYSGFATNGYLKKKFDLANLPEGMYLLTIHSTETITRKIIKL